MIRSTALLAAIAVGLLAVSGAGGADAQTPKRGGTVVVFTGAPVPAGCLNPLGPCNVPLPNSWLGEVLEGAFEIGPDLSYRPNLVTRVDTVSATPFVLDYRIRRDAHWSDGRPVSASDFVFTFETFRRYPVTTAGVGDTRQAWRIIRRVVPLDSHSVRVVFRSRTASWRDLFDPILPRHVLAGTSVTEVWRRGIDDPSSGTPIGSGPFLVRSFEPGEELILGRNPNYWGPHTAYLDRLVFRTPSGGPPAVLDAYRRGEFDLGWSFDLPPQAFTAFRSLGGKIVSTPAAQWEHLAIRIGPGGHPALASKLVRRAVAYALDRGTIVRGVWGDRVPGIEPLHSAVFPGQSRSYEPNWDRYRHRPAVSRRLLEQSGCRRSADGIYVCGGVRLSLRLMTNAGNTFRARTIELVQAQLRSVGIEAIPTYVSPSAFLSQVVPSGDYDLALFGWQVGPAGKSDAYRCGHDQNFYGYCSRLTNRDLVQTDLIVDEAKRARVLNAADRKLARDVPLIPLYQLPLFVTYRPTIRNVVPHPQLAGQTWNAENWWLAK